MSLICSTVGNKNVLYFILQYYKNVIMTVHKACTVKYVIRVHLQLIISYSFFTSYNCNIFKHEELSNIRKKFPKKLSNKVMKLSGHKKP
jgi:hypothetical protein